MQTFLPLEDLGPRIMLLGPTNSGKSSLAEAVNRQTGMPAIHLDQLRHLPNTMWEQRPDEDFAALHDSAIEGESWIMDGSYSKLMPQRLLRTTGLIVLDAPLPVRIRRYLWRSTFQKERAGGLEGNQDRITWAMLAWLWKTRNHSESTRAWVSKTSLPHLFVQGSRELDALYRAWRLDPPL